MSKKISYSQFSMWQNCPHAWKLKYVDGHRIDDTSIHTIFGTAMHEVIQEWLDILYNQSETVAKTRYLHDTLKDKLLHLFKENIKLDESGNKTFLTDKPTLYEFYNHGCLILDYIQVNYKKIFPTEYTVLHSIEYPLEITVKNNVTYIGFIDIVTHNTLDDTYKLYDLKTSTSGWSDYQKKDPVKVGQLLLYKRFFAQQLNLSEKQISVEYIILKRTIFENAQYPTPRVSKFEPAHGTPSLNKTWVLFQNFVNTAFDDDGNYINEQIAIPSKDACRFCKFKDRKDLCAVGVTT